MAAQSMNQKVEPLRSLPCLITESSDELASMCEEVNQEIKPAGFIERIFVEDVVALIWDIQRLRRSKTAIINAAFLAALQGILAQLLCPRDFDDSYEHEHAAEDLARSWFDNKEAKTRVATLLRNFGLDERAIEAEAFRLRVDDLERLDRMLALAEVRRDRALRCIADYRQAKQVKQSTDQILDHDDVPRLIERQAI
jgi:hypothetical protein